MLETFVSESIPLARAVAPSLPDVVDGFIKPSTRPGLGIDLDEDEIRAHPLNRISVLRLFEPGWESRRGARPGAKEGRRRAQLGDRSGGRQLEEEHDAR